MCKQKHLVLFVFVRKFFEEYLDWKHFEIKGLDYADIFFWVGCYPTNSIQNDLPVYAVVCECDEITEFLGRVNNIDFRRYLCRLRTFMNPAFSNGDQIYATTLAERGFIYMEHAGENLIYCPFCFNFFYNDLTTDENVCTHAPNCPYAARAWNQHGNNNIGAMNRTVDIEYREIYRNVHNLFNLPFANRERTRPDNVNASVRSISIRNLNEFQDIHSRENQIDNQLSVAENIDSSNLVHQETETNDIALPDFNRSPQELNKTNDYIPYKMEIEKIGDAASSFQLDCKDNPLKRDPAFKAAFIIDMEEAIKDDGNILSADKIYEKLVADNVKKSSSGLNITRATSNGEVPAADVAKDIEKLRTLKEMNNQLRQQTVCKICMDKEVDVIFLPCGHIVSCTDCAAAIKECPVCRNLVKGLVRAFFFL